MRYNTMNDHCAKYNSETQHVTIGKRQTFVLSKSDLEVDILVPRAHDLSGLRQESRALGTTISGMRRRCRLRETGWAEFGYFLCYFKMVDPSALVFRPLVKGNEALGTRL